VDFAAKAGRAVRKQSMNTKKARKSMIDRSNRQDLIIILCADISRNQAGGKAENWLMALTDAAILS
jgi:hypothetical protein